MSFYVKGFQEVQDYSGALWQTDGVVAPAHRWVGVRITRTSQNPRRRRQHLALARHCEEDSCTKSDHFEALI